MYTWELNISNLFVDNVVAYSNFYWDFVSIVQNSAATQSPNVTLTNCTIQNVDLLGNLNFFEFLASLKVDNLTLTKMN